MTTWTDVTTAAPDLAAAVWARFTATRHHVIATLRADGSPRVSGTEVVLDGDDLQIGSMPHAWKVLDLQRDGRYALHANPGDGSMIGGDAKIAGVARELVDPDRGHHVFVLATAEVVLSTLDGDAMRVTSWSPEHGLRRWRRPEHSPPQLLPDP